MIVNVYAVIARIPVGQITPISPRLGSGEDGLP